MRLPGVLLLIAVALPARAGEPDLARLALQWVRGDYRAPLLCEFEGRPHRGLRRVRIAPGPPSAARPSDRILFFDLEAEQATRCFSDLGSEEPNLVGTLEISFPGPSRPDTARRDFDAALRRSGGFSFRVERGRLRVEPIGAGSDGAREVDFAGGSATISRVERGSDAARRLGEIPGRRRLRLVLEADETRWEFPLVEVAPR